MKGTRDRELAPGMRIGWAVETTGGDQSAALEVCPREVLGLAMYGSPAMP